MASNQRNNGWIVIAHPAYNCIIDSNLSAGFLMARRGGSSLMSDYGGVAKVAPVLAGFLLFAALSSLALPGMASFVGEFLVLIGSFETARWWTVVAATGVILAALYLLWAYQRVFHTEPDAANADFAEIKRRDALNLGLIAYPTYLGIKAYHLPMINDITTDPLDPPRFDVVARLRPRGTVEYAGLYAAEQQRVGRFHWAPCTRLRNLREWMRGALR